MTLDEAIAHCIKEAEACDTDTVRRREHSQLAEWLQELKDRRCDKDYTAPRLTETGSLSPGATEPYRSDPKTEQTARGRREISAAGFLYAVMLL